MNFIIWIVFILLKQNKLKSHEVCKNKGFYGILIPSEKDILEFNQYMKSDKQEKVSIFLVDIQCQQFEHFIA